MDQVIIHEHSCQCYSSGVKKCEGSFTYGRQNNDWNYWNDLGDSQSAALYFSCKTFAELGEIEYENGFIKVSLLAKDGRCRIITNYTFINRHFYKFVEEAPKFVGGESEMLKFINENFHNPVEQERIQTTFYIFVHCRSRW
jgi:hypothetical protein